MAITNAQRQANRRAKHMRMQAALMAIIVRLHGNDKPLAVELRTMAEDALNG
jgi:hypothetical protein